MNNPIRIVVLNSELKQDRLSVSRLGFSLEEPVLGIDDIKIYDEIDKQYINIRRQKNKKGAPLVLIAFDGWGRDKFHTELLLLIDSGTVLCGLGLERCIQLQED